jgi:hypothetical protein
MVSVNTKHVKSAAIAASLLLFSVTGSLLYTTQSNSASPAHRGRIQIQGPDVESDKRFGKDGLSFAWSQDTVVSKAKATAELDQMIAKLNKTEAADRADAIKKAKKFINDAPAAGVDAPVSRSWGNKDVSAKRIDIEVIPGNAFSN